MDPVCTAWFVPIVISRRQDTGAWRGRLFFRWERKGSGDRRFAMGPVRTGFAITAKLSRLPLFLHTLADLNAQLRRSH
jgi:hypothetical protein